MELKYRYFDMSIFGTVSIHSGGVLPRRFVKKSLVEWALEKENPSRVARVLKKKPCDALIPVCLSNDKRLALTSHIG